VGSLAERVEESLVRHQRHCAAHGVADGVDKIVHVWQSHWPRRFAAADFLAWEPPQAEQLRRLGLEGRSGSRTAWPEWVTPTMRRVAKMAILEFRHSRCAELQITCDQTPHKWLVYPSPKPAGAKPDGLFLAFVGRVHGLVQLALTPGFVVETSVPAGCVVMPIVYSDRSDGGGAVVIKVPMDDAARVAEAAFKQKAQSPSTMLLE
jgi:hypothetical protein